MNPNDRNIPIYRPLGQQYDPYVLSTLHQQNIPYTSNVQINTPSTSHQQHNPYIPHISNVQSSSVRPQYTPPIYQNNPNIASSSRYTPPVQQSKIPHIRPLQNQENVTSVPHYTPSRQPTNINRISNLHVVPHNKRDNLHNLPVYTSSGEANNDRLFKNKEISVYYPGKNGGGSNAKTPMFKPIVSEPEPDIAGREEFSIRPLGVQPIKYVAPKFSPILPGKVEQTVRSDPIYDNIYGSQQSSSIYTPPVLKHQPSSVYTPPILNNQNKLPTYTPPTLSHQSGSVYSPPHLSNVQKNQYMSPQVPQLSNINNLYDQPTSSQGMQSIKPVYTPSHLIVNNPLKNVPHVPYSPIKPLKNIFPSTLHDIPHKSTVTPLPYGSNMHVDFEGVHAYEGEDEVDRELENIVDKFLDEEHFETFDDYAESLHKAHKTDDLEFYDVDDDDVIVAEKVIEFPDSYEEEIVDNNDVEDENVVNKHIVMQGKLVMPSKMYVLSENSYVPSLRVDENTEVVRQIPVQKPNEFTVKSMINDLGNLDIKGKGKIIE